MNSGKYAVSLGVIPLVLGATAQAQTPAGAVISHQSLVEYYVPAEDKWYEATSTITVVTVSSSPDFDILQKNKKTSTAGALVEFPHTILNSGNELDRYHFQVDVPTGSPAIENLVVYNDMNFNGVVDSGEPEITVSDPLDVAGTQAVIIRGFVPRSATEGTQYFVEFAATSEFDNTITKSMMDEVMISSVPPFEIRIGSTPICSNAVSPNSTVEYDVVMRNVDRLADFAQDYVIDGAMQRGFLVFDDIPANTALEPDQLIDYSPNSGVLVYRNLAGEWIAYDQYTGADVATAFGMFIPELTLQNQAQGAGFEYAVRISPTVTAGMQIENSISVDFNNDGIVDAMSNVVCTTIDGSGTPTTTGDVRFLQASPEFRQELVNLSSGTRTPQHNRDDHFVDSSRYVLDTKVDYNVGIDGVYLEVLAPEFNTNAGVADSTYNGAPISVKLISSETGDTVFVQMLETGVNTGIFRSEAAIALSASNAGNGADCSPLTLGQCFLLSTRNDKIYAEFTNANGTTTQVDLATVDPAGVVFNSVSFEAVAGARVEIRSLDGSIPVDAITGLPIAVQTTDESGAYSLPNLSDGQYYVDVIPPTGYSFRSSVTEEKFGTLRNVNQYSYGRDGYEGIAGSGLFSAGFNTAVDVFDIPIDPNLDTGVLALEKSVNVSYAEFGDTVNYTVTLKNSSGSPFFNTQVHDTPAPGFLLIEGAVRVDDTIVDITRDGRGIVVPIGTIEDGQTKTLEYRMKIGPETRPGDAVNSAYATANVGAGLSATSPAAKAIVNISDEGLMSDRGYIIGNVWVDLNADGRRDAGEPPMPDTRVWRDDGSWIITDAEGRFTFYGQKEGKHMLRVDPASLPDSFVTSGRSARHFKDGQAILVDIRDGDIVRADFALTCEATDKNTCSENALKALVETRASAISAQSLLDEAMRYEGQIGQEVRRQQRQRSAFSSADGDISSGIVGGRRLKSSPFDTAQSNPSSASSGANTRSQKTRKSAPDPENIARTIGKINVKKGKWLWPEVSDDGLQYARGGPIIAAIRPGIRPALFVNGKEVSDKRLGARIETADRKTQIVAWYGVELPAGKNTVAIKGVDGFGNLRNLAETDLYSPSEGVELVIKPPVGDAYADGHTPIAIKVMSLDKAGMPARGVQFITLRAEQESNGEVVRFLSEDLQPSTPGHQIRLEEGEGYVEIAPLKLPGRIRIIVDADGDMNTFRSIEVKAPTRDLFAVGILDVSAHAYNISGDLEPANPEDYPEKLETTGRSSLFIKGRIKGNYLLTLAYDSDKSSTEGLFRDIDPEKYYPIYGESSVKGFDAQSETKLYVRVENENMSAMWGDFRTDVRQSESLVNQRQSLSGANFHATRGKLEARAYAAEARQQRRTVRFSGQGVALFYTLPNAPITPGSETLTVEVRAKDNPGLIIEERSLVRFVDYLVDVQTGQIILQEPIPSTDVDGNFLFLRARYETVEEGKTGILAGGEISYKTDKTAVHVGGYYDDSRADMRSSKALSLAVEQRLQSGRAYGEVGVMESELDDESITTGTAFRLGGEVKVGGIDIDGRLARADSDFVNPDSPIIAGRTEARVSARGKVLGASTAAVSGTYSENNDTGDSRTVVEARYEKRFGQWAVQIGPRYQDIYTADGNQEESFTAATWRLSRNINLFNETASAFVEGEQSLSDDRQRLVLGAESSLGKKTRAYAVHRIIDELPDQTAATGLSTTQSSRHQGNTVFGVETSILPNTRTFGEWRQDDVYDNRSGQASFGIRADWPIADGVTLSPSFERTQALGRASENTGEEAEDVGGATNVGTISGTDDSTSLSVAISDVSSDVRRKTARLETRLNSSSHFWGARLGWAEKYGENLTGATKFQLTRDNVHNGEDSQLLKLTTGLAWRPQTSGAPDIFGLYQFLDEQNSARTRQIHLVSSHANIQLGDKWTVSGRVAGKIEDSEGIANATQLFSAKVRYDVNKRFDTELRLSNRRIDWNEAVEWNLGFGVGIKASDKFRLHGGYNIGGFNDADLDPSGYNRSGVYGGVTVALTEDWFSFLKPKD